MIGHGEFAAMAAWILIGLVGMADAKVSADSLEPF